MNKTTSYRVAAKQNGRMSPSVVYVRDTETDAAWVSVSAHPIDVARREVARLESLGRVASYAPDAESTDTAWLYVDWETSPGLRP
jgi:hypothetical protein